MFRSALKSLSGTLVKTARDTVEDFNPTPDNIMHGVFDRLAQQGIANLSYRSPILSSLAQVAMDNFQKEVGKKKYVNEYVNSSKADWLRENVKGKMGESASEKDITREMRVVITKITDAIELEGVENVKKAGLFKEYEKIFEEYSKDKKESAPAHDGTPEAEAAPTDTKVTNQTLANIEANTKETVDILKSGLSSESGTEAPVNYANDDRIPRTGVDGKSDAPKNNGSKFVDPLTGMPSITAAVGSIGGDLLARVFDDQMLDKMSTKIKSFLYPDAVTDDSASKVVPEERRTADTALKDSVDILTKEGVSEADTDDSDEDKRDIAALNASTLEKLLDVSKEVRDEIKKLPRSESPIQAVKSDIKSVLKGGAAKAGIARTFTPKKAVPVKPDNPKDALADGKDNDKVPEEKKSITDTLGDKAQSMLGKYALPALAVAGAGAVGYGAGMLLDKGIGAGISKVTGVEGNTLGAWAHDMFNGPQKEDTPFKYTGPAIPKPSTAVAQLTEIKQVSNAIDKENSQKTQSAPVILNNQMTSNTGSSGGSTTLSGPRGSVRNIENTFERVQMQDFWPRSI